MINFLLCAAAISAPPDEGRIRLTPAMLINETGFGEAVNLVDEQDAGEGNPPKQPFFPGWTAWQYPVSVAVDLGSECEVDRLAIYNESGENSINLSSGAPFKWKPITVSLKGYRSWNDFPIKSKTRWLRLTLDRPTNVSELIVYGRRLTPPVASPPKKVKRVLPTMDQFIGVNAFIDDPLEKISTPAGFAREYHPWIWDTEAPDGLTRFQPSGAAGGNTWFFDDYYAKLKAAGVTVSPVVWQSAEQIFKTKRKEAKPILAGSNSEDPLSYRAHAEHFFQYAARYGSRKVPDTQLTLAPGQPRLSGLGTLRYLENWNEPDKTWEDREGRFNPFDLAAMSSADYDGHLGKMGKGVGVKAADPSMKLVLGGLAGLNLDFLKAIKYWADANRGGSFPADAINLHHYSSSSNEQWFQPGGKGISPEADHLREKMAAIADWRDANIPDRELWLTEFGYDTNPQSPLHTPVIGSMDAEHVQAAWIIRAFMALAAARVDRAAMFMLRDVDSKGTGVFATCGLVTEKGKWEPKPSYFYQAALRKHLSGYRFSKILSKDSDAVWQYEFRDAKGKEAIVVWCPTSEDKRVTAFRLPAEAATLVTLSDRTVSGTTTELKAKDASVTFEVSETPKIVFLK